MQGRQFRQVVDLGNNIIVDEGRFLEELAAMNDAMAYRGNLTHILDNGVGTRAQNVQNHAHCRRMVGQRELVHELVFVDAVLMKGLFTANALA